VGYASLATTAAALALVLTPIARTIAIRLGAVDAPGPRRIHGRPVARLGGVALLAAFAATLALAAAVGTRPLGDRAGWLFAGLAVVVLTGAADDLHGLGPAAKLLGETLAALLALAGGYGLAGFTNPLTGGFVPLGLAGGIVTVVWIVAIANAFNLIDGLDGLAAGVGLIAAAALFLIALFEARPEAAALWAVLGGSLAGFLVYNFNPASIFLGDSGSLFVGYLVAVLAIESLEKGPTAVVVLAPILALGLPIMDVVLAVVRRTAAAGLRGVLEPDRAHIHHRLVDDGLTHRRAVLLLYGICMAFGGLAFAAVAVQGPANAVVVAVAALVVLVVARRLRGRP
jgi:UDP-GlcNAc:undecaprenyl-phosphate GlcNAc-1-phosphate transferase